MASTATWSENFAVALAHRPRGSDRGGFAYAQEIQRQLAIGSKVLTHSSDLLIQEVIRFKSYLPEEVLPHTSEIFCGRQSESQREISAPPLRLSVLITMDRRIELVISTIESETSGPWDIATLACLVISPLHASVISSNMKPALVRLDILRTSVCERLRRCCGQRTWQLRKC